MMRLFAAIGGVVLVLAGGCATREFVFRVVDADTGRPIKGVHVYQQNVRTEGPGDTEHVEWAFPTVHVLPTGEDGVFSCRLDNGHWHVLEFRERSLLSESAKETEHVEVFATVPPEQNYVQLGERPLDGRKVGAQGTITVEIETYGAQEAYSKSPENAVNMMEEETGGGAAAGDKPFEKLCDAIRGVDVEKVREYLDQGGDVNLRNHNGWTLLMAAAIDGHTGVIDLLLKRGAEVNAVAGNRPCTALAVAAECGNEEAVERLLAAGASTKLAKGLCGGSLMKFVEEGPGRRNRRIREMLKNAGAR